MKHLNMAQEATRTEHGRATAEWIAERSRRAVEHYATEGFQRESARGRVVPYLDPAAPDFVKQVSEVADSSRMTDLESVARELPASFGSRMLRVTQRRVGVVGGREITDLVEGTADIRRLGMDSNSEHVKELDVLLVALPVVGREPPLTADELDVLARRIIPAAREFGIPTVGMTLSDPWRVDATRKIAGTVDWLLTTDPEGPNRYDKHMTTSGRVMVVDSHFNPLRFSPVGRERHRAGGALFSGRLPSTAQPERLRAWRSILSGLRRHDTKLTLASSAVMNGVPEKSRGLFPSEYLNFLTYQPDDELRSRVLRLFDLHVLAHLQPGAGHAHPLETLEALASGGVCMSTYSVAMNNDYPHVLLPDGSDDAELEVALLGHDRPHLRRLQMEGVRRAFARQTADRLMSEILRQTGLEDTPRKTVVLWRANEDDSDSELFASQVVTPDVDLRRVGMYEPAPGDAVIDIRVGRQTTGHYYLAQDLINAFRMASVSTVCMSVDAPESRVFEIVSDHECKEVDVVASWIGADEAQFDGTFVMDPSAIQPGGCSYAPAGLGRPKLLSVIVPVYNNGPYLVRKCLESLRRSTAFPDMEIILVDDGSTSPETRAIVREMAGLWDNVRTYLFPPGGSGSASRPRNKGLEMASTPWVTYLDPDNEGVGDGYAALLRICQETGVDFAIGDMLRYAKTRTLARNVGTLRSAIRTNEHGVGEVPHDALTRIDFQPMSIQALVADTQWLKSLHLEQPVGALGQDSLFFQQMLHGARTVALVDKPIHTYYGEVAGSMVNTVTPTFFRKYIPLEEARSRWLREHDLFDEYVRRRMRRYVTVWFLPKFNKAVSLDDREEAFELLRSLCGTYGLELRFAADGVTVTLD